MNERLPILPYSRAGLSDIQMRRSRWRGAALGVGSVVFDAFGIGQLLMEHSYWGIDDDWIMRLCAVVGLVLASFALRDSVRLARSGRLHDAMSILGLVAATVGAVSALGLMLV